MELKQKSAGRMELTKADEILRKRMSEIDTVARWANELGFNSEKVFSRKYRNEYGKRPKSVLIKMKLERALFLLEHDPEMNCFEVARAIGKKDEKALNFFFRTHMGISPKKWVKIRSESC